MLILCVGCQSVDKGTNSESAISAREGELIPIQWRSVDNTPFVKASGVVPPGATIVADKAMDEFGGINVTLYTKEDDEDYVYGLLTTSKGQYEVGTVGSFNKREPEDITVTSTQLFGKLALKITGEVGANYAVTHYFAIDSDSNPKGLLTVDTGHASEQDVDGDGYSEVVSIHGTPTRIFLYRWNKDHAEIADVNEALKVDSVTLTPGLILEAENIGGEKPEQYRLIPEGLIPVHLP